VPQHASVPGWRSFQEKLSRMTMGGVEGLSWIFWLEGFGFRRHDAAEEFLNYESSECRSRSG
jgi:hypothetical protein